jgi:hypothetical protein
MVLPVTKGKRVPSYALSRRQASPAQQTVHDLNNLLGALRLRVDILTKDSTCMWAQSANLQALSRILDDALGLAAQLETPPTAVKARRRSSR